MRYLPIALVIGVIIAFATVFVVPASSACPGDTVSVTTGESEFGVTSSDSSCDGSGPGGTPVPGRWVHQVVCRGGLATCDAEGMATCDNGTPMVLTWFVPDGGIAGPVTNNCDLKPDPGPTIEDIARAFRQIGLPSSDIRVQPAGGETLINFDTNFFTKADPFNRTVTLLGRSVDLRIRATSFRWAWGDGRSTTTRSPGSSYPDLEIIHRYTSQGVFTPTVSTTWEADYRVDTGAWSAVPGSVTRSGDGATLRVRTATPLLVGRD